MKKAISIILAITIILTLVCACGKSETASQISEAKVTLPNSTGTKAVVEGEAVLTTQAYILSRSYFEKLKSYDTNAFNAQEYKELLTQAVEAFRVTDGLCSSFASHAGTLAEAEEKDTAQQQEKAQCEVMSTSAGKNRTSVGTVAHAAEEKSAAVKYAEEITKTFDNAKNGQKLKTLAEQYGTDVKKAKVMLEQAQAILEGAAYTEQANFESKCHEVAVETKAACSIATFVVSIAVAAPAVTVAGGASIAGIVEAGGVAFNGVSALIDVGTAASIHLSNGEGNEDTLAWEKVAETVAPVSTLFAIGGGIQNIVDYRDPAKTAEQVNNAAQALLTVVGIGRDYVQDDTVLGVSANIYNGYREIICRSADTSNPEAAKEVLIKTGISEEALNSTDQNNTSSATEQQTTEFTEAVADKYIEEFGELVDPNNPLDVDAYSKNIDTAFKECAVAENKENKDTGKSENSSSGEGSSATSAEQSKPADTESTPSQSSVSETDGTLSAVAVAGRYSFTSQSGNPWAQNVTVNDETHLTFTDDTGASMTGSYDKNTGVFTYSETGEMNGEEIVATCRVTFTVVGGDIQGTMVMTLGDESFTTTAMKE